MEPKRSESEIIELLKMHGIAVQIGATYSVRCQFAQMPALTLSSSG